MLRIHLFYCLSGFLSLAYQVVWFRIYVDQFGATNLTFALVLCSFILGLGFGGLFSKHVVERLARLFSLSDPIRVYGLVEMIVGATVFLTFISQWFPEDAWGHFPYYLQDGVYIRTLPYEISQLVQGTLCVFIPCFFMGVTFPLLCAVFPLSSGLPSSLYAWNTLGACASVLACQLIFLPMLGHDLTLWIAALANLGLGVYFLVTGGMLASLPHGPTAERDEAATNRHVEEKEERASGDRFDDLRVLLLYSCLSGLLAGALEGDMFKRLAFLGSGSSSTMSFISFWAILAIFLASWVVRASPGIRLVHIKMAFVLAVISYALAWNYAYPVRAWFGNRDGMAALAAAPELKFAERGVSVIFPTSLWQALLYVGMFVFPGFLAISLLFPYVCNYMQAARRHLGVTYGLNTLAFCVGMIAFTMLAPRVNIFYSLKLIMVLLVVGVGLFISIREGEPWLAWKPLLAITCFAAGIYLTPAGFDKSYMIPYSAPARCPVRAVKSNGVHTTYVVDTWAGDVLYFDNHAMSGGGRGGQVYMRLMAHFPLLAQPQPQRALLICFGVGNTASAIAFHDTISQLDIVDLNDKVFKTAPEFAASNHQVYLDPRVRLIHDDGRNFLRTTDQTYDLITSEPPPPMNPGIYRLYSKEYYEQALDRLTPGGMMTQWLPIFQMPREAVDLAISTFVDTFPHTLMFAGQWRDFILVGSPSPIDVTRIEKRFGHQKHVLDDLRNLAVRCRTPEALLARVVQGDSGLRRRYGGLPVIHDQHNQLANIYPDPAQPAVIEYNPEEMLADIGAERLVAYDKLRSIVTNLGKLQYHLRDFPTDTMATVKESAARNVALAHVDWPKVRWYQKQFDVAAKSGKYSEALKIDEEVKALAGDIPGQLIKLSRLHLQFDHHGEAVNTLNSFLDMMPAEPIGYSLLGTAYIRMRQYKRAETFIKRALSISPDNSSAHYNLGRILAARKQYDRAIEHLQEAVRLESDLAAYRNHLGLVFAESGQFEKAIELYEAGLKIDPDNETLQQGLSKTKAMQAGAGG